MVVKFKLCQDAFAVAMTVTNLCLLVTIMGRAPEFSVCSPGETTVFSGKSLLLPSYDGS